MNNKCKNYPPRKRETNIELLRIIAMMLVLLAHNFINGDVTGEVVRADLGHAVLTAFQKSLTFSCVPVFIVISGYFGIRWKWKGLTNYLFQIGFWGGLVYLMTWLLGMHDFSAARMANNMTLFLVNGNWFFWSYLGLYMLAPLLNAYIEKATERQMMWMTAAFFAYQTVFGWMLKHGEFYFGLTATSLVGWYLIGAWVRKSTWRGFHLKPWQNLGVFFGIGAVNITLNIVTQYMGAEKDVFSYISPLQAIATTYLFLFCRSLTIKRGERVITFFASSAFAGLLMHSWEGTTLYHNSLQWIADTLPHPFFCSIPFMIMFFITACVIDKLRIGVWNIIASKVFK